MLIKLMFFLLYDYDLTLVKSATTIIFKNRKENLTATQPSGWKLKLIQKSLIKSIRQAWRCSSILKPQCPDSE